MDLSGWLERIQRQHPQAIALGLDRVREVHGRLAPGRPARRVITVAGTNGKGSTVAFIDAIARAAGHRVGAYTSPHLLRYNERVRIDGQPVDDAALVEAFEAVEAARGDTPLTYFEAGTLAALWLFARAGLDLAVLEVGLGGRLDAVNVVDPDVAVITQVDIDHTDWLGTDREAIGIEKAGILRSGRPLVLGEVDPPASVLREAYLRGAFAIRGGSDYLVDDLGGQWVWREPGFRVELPRPRLDAPVQLWNAAAAIAALRASRLRIPRQAMVDGVAAASVPGRLQAIDAGNGRTWLLDVGHNPSAAREVARALRARGGGPCVAVLGMLSDKDTAGFVRALAPSVSSWWLAGLEDQTERGLDARSLRARVDECGDVVDIAGHGGLDAMLAAALAAVPGGGCVLVTGSFFIVAAALRRLQDGAGPAPV